jgi:glycosyltransferase involved in cell wall biosynthesis
MSYDKHSNPATNKPIKIAFNATAYDLAYQGGGIHRYTGILINEFVSNYNNNMLYVSDSSQAGIANTQSTDIFNTSSRLHEASTKSSLARLAYQQMLMPRSLTAENATLLYSPVPEGMLNPVTKQIITVHDLIPLVIPESTQLLKYYYKIFLPRLLKVSDAIITVSESTKQDIEKYYPTVDKPIHVRHQGYNSHVFNVNDSSKVAKVTNKYGIQDAEYLLAVGERRAYKNTESLIQSFARLSLKDLKLVIVGKLNKSAKDIHDVPRQFGVQDRVKFLGYVPDEDLANLYQGAKAFIFPSLYEGFGIPLLEAMACGCPIAASKTSSIPEVCGSAAIYFNPHDIDDMAKIISDLLASESLQSKCRMQGLERIKSFSSALLSQSVINLCYEYARY